MAKKKKTVHHVDDLRQLPEPELVGQLHEAYRQLFTLRLQLATRQQNNSSALGITRRRIARIRTVQRERQRAVLHAAAADEGE